MKTVFITGGASGIGAAAVRKFHAEGWNVAFMDIDAARGGELAASLADSDRVLFAAGSTTVRSDIRRAVAAAIEKFGRLDNVLDISDEELKLMIDTNIYGTVDTLREAVPEIIKAGGGTVVINASDQWFVGKAHSFAYGLTKGALGQITRSLSIDLGKYNIRVNAVFAGTIHTPLVDNLFDRFSKAENKPVEEYWAEENALYARGSVGRPEEVAEMMYFLASDASSFCTGGHYLVDGGLVAG